MSVATCRWTWLGVVLVGCVQPPTATWDNAWDDRDQDGVVALLDCDDLDAKVGRQVCARCGDTVHTGITCQGCIDPKRTGSACDTCVAKFKGPTCDFCTDTQHTGPTCDACVDATKAGPACDMRRFPGGAFQLGSSTGQADEMPVHPVTLSPFGIDTTEVTVAAYSQCVAAGACQIPAQKAGRNWGVAGREQHPVNVVSWHDAAAFCAWAGKRLPTEAEWEYAARNGGSSNAYPWGSLPPDCDRAVMSSDLGPGCGTNLTFAVCTKTAGKTPNGLCDMAGNVWEWVADWKGYDLAEAATNPTGPASGTHRVVRGGGFDVFAKQLRTSARGEADPAASGANVGFRCAVSAP